MLSTNFVSAQLQNCGNIRYESHFLTNGKLQIDVIFENYSLNLTNNYAAIDFNIEIASKCGIGTPKPDAFIIDKAKTSASLNPNVGATPVLTFPAKSSISYSLVNLKSFTFPGSNARKRLFTIELVPANPLEECCVSLDATYFPERNLTDGVLTTNNFYDNNGPMLYLSNGNGGVIACSVNKPTNPFELFCNLPENALTIAGRVVSPFSVCPGSLAPKPIPNVLMSFNKVTPTGTNTAQCSSSQILTNSTGDYLSCGVPGNNNYQVRASKDCSDNPNCGLNTLDLVFIWNHILGNTTLAWWQLIAADVNYDPKNSSVISASLADISILRQAILGTNPLKECWRFIPRTGSYIQNPAINAPYDVTLNTTSVDNISFVGIKMGDVTGNCYCGLLGQRPSREEGETFLELPDAFIAQGEITDIPVRTTENNNPLVYSLGMNIDPEQFEIVGVIPNEESGIRSDNFNLEGLERGQLKMLWALESENPVIFHEGQTLFTLRVRAKRDASIREAILLDNELFENNLSTIGDENQKSIVINFREHANSRGGILIDNELKSTATISEIGTNAYISYSLPKQDNIDISVYNQQGKQVFFSKKTATAGVNLAEIDLSSNEQSGMYFYLINTANGVITGRFIKVQR